MRPYKNNYNPNLYIFRRIREPKEEVNYFIEELRAKFKIGILETYLIPRDLREEEERIDVVIIYDGLKEEKVLNEANEISDHIFDKCNKEILPIRLSKEKYNKILKNFSTLEKFLRSKLTIAPVPNPDPEERITETIYYNKGIEFLNTAKDSYKKKRFVPAFDDAYHACEHFMKTIILKLTPKLKLAKGHKSVIRQFISDGLKIQEEEKRKRLRNKIYNATVNKRAKLVYGVEWPTKEDVEKVLSLAKKLNKYIQEKINIKELIEFLFLNF